MKQEKKYFRTWAEINLKQLCENLNYIKKQYIYKKNIMCVLKADAYGHGSIIIAQELKKMGINFFCVATIYEAVKLRIKFPQIYILLLGYFNETHIKEIIKYNIIVSIYNNYTLNLILKYNNIKAHIKFDTGMSRLGFHYNNINENLIDNLKKISSNIDGIYTHFSSAETDINFTKEQFKRFKNIVNKIELNIGHIKNKHCCNTYASTYINDNISNFIRLGIGLYGYELKDNKIKPIMTFKSRIIQIKKIKKGEFISYNKTKILKTDSIIAIISVGYADGYFRNNSKDGYVYINNQKSKILGSICMDMLIVDITNNKNISINDEVILFNTTYFTAQDLAKLNNTISYEILCSISKRVPRIYNI